MICKKCKKTVPDGAYCLACGANQDKPQRTARRSHRANGSGTAIRRGKTWTAVVSEQSEAIITPEGKKKLIQHRKWIGGFATKTEALAFAANYHPDPAPEREPYTLRHLWESWSENELEKRSHDRRYSYKAAASRLEPVMPLRIDKITIDDLQACVNTNATSYDTAKDMRSLLSLLYKRAMAQRDTTVNLAQFLALPPVPDSEPVPFSEAEVEAFWRAFDAGDLFCGYPLLMIYSSMMPGELLSCKKSMIRWDQCEIFGCGRKTKKRRETPIVYPEFITPVLRRLADEPGEKLLRMNKDNFYKKFHETTKRLGIRDLTPYACRHTTATEAVKQGVALPIVQQIMRHSKIASTQRYVHLGTAEAHAGINTLERTATDDC